jgi:Tat protein translocase TatB subunit
MFGFGFIEIMLIAVLALIFIGPKQLPEVARVIARLMNEWKRVTSEFTSSFQDLRSDLHTRIEEKNSIRPEPPAASATPAGPPVQAAPKQDEPK